MRQYARSFRDRFISRASFNFLVSLLESCEENEENRLRIMPRDRIDRVKETTASLSLSGNFPPADRVKVHSREYPLSRKLRNNRSRLTAALSFDLFRARARTQFFSERPFRTRDRLIRSWRAFSSRDARNKSRHRSNDTLSVRGDVAYSSRTFSPLTISSQDLVPIRGLLGPSRLKSVAKKLLLKSLGCFVLDDTNLEPKFLRAGTCC